MMKTVIASLFTVICALALGGCPSFVRARGPAFAPTAAPAGSAIVYFYRPATRIMSDYTFALAIPGGPEDCYSVESGGYVAYVASPGSLTVSGQMVPSRPAGTHTLMVAPGDELYVRLAQVGDGNPTFTEVSAADGRAEIASTRSVDACSAR